MSSKADPRSSFREAVTRKLGRIAWTDPGDPPAPSEALREYAARLEAESLRVRQRAEEIEDTLAIVRECIAALPGPRPAPMEPGPTLAADAPTPGAAEPPVALVRRADPLAEPLPPLRAWLLGGFRLGVGGRIVRPASSTKVWRVLKFLICRGGGPVASDVLADTFWRKSAPSAALQSVYSVVHSLRGLLADLGAGESLASSGGYYALAPGVELSTDVAFFRGRVEAAARASAGRRDEEARALLEEAVDAYRGEFLPDDPYERWAAEERESLATRHLRALERLSGLIEAAGMAERAVEYRLRILRDDPLREESHRALIRHFLATGRRTEAVRQYRALERALDRELGMRPDPDTRALVEDVLEG